MIDPLDCLISNLKFLKFRLSLNMVKDDWHLLVWLPIISPKNFKVQIYLCTWWKMIDSSQVWLTNISPKILKFRFSLHIVKEWLTLLVWLPIISPKILKFIFTFVHGERLLTPQVWLPNISPKILKFIYSLSQGERWWNPPRYDCPISHLKF